METIEQATLLPPYKETQNYGFFGYRGTMCDLAIGSDNAPMLMECIDREFIDENSVTLMNVKVIDHCERVAPKCWEAWMERLHG